MKRFLSKSRKNSFKNKRKNSKRKLSRKMKGGSPASSRVMGFLPNSCNSPQELNLPPVDTDISNMKLYATTGGARKLKGGAVRMPSEYYGVDSGRYQADANLGRSPQSYGYMNGGNRKSKRSRRSRNIRGGSPASNRVMSFLPKQNGGAIRMPSEYYGVDSGRYQADANLGRTPNSYGYMTGGCGGMPCCSGCGCGCRQQRVNHCGRVGGKRKHKGGFVRDGSIQNFRGIPK